MIRFYWNYNREIPHNVAPHSTDLTLDRVLTSEAAIKEMIAKSEGDRALAQYIVISRMERVRKLSNGGRCE